MNNPTIPPTQRGIPEALNARLVAGMCAALLFVYFVLPVLARGSAWWLWCLVPIVAVSNTHWSLIHEAIHSSLSLSPAVNELFGRALAIVFGAPFEALRIGHLQHHRRNGTIFDRPELFDPAVEERGAYARRYYFQLVIGLYVSELMSLVFVLLPRRTGEWALSRFAPGADEVAVEYRAYVSQRLYQPEAIQRARVDALCSLSVFTLSFLFYGERWPFLCLFFLLRGILISVLDNSYHYGGERSLYSAYNAKAPRWWSLLLLHFHFHAVHHRHPSISWYQLPNVFAEENDSFAEHHALLIFRQFKGPIRYR